ncbi:DUF6492 family protein [Nitratireductor sp. StC3]|uniref:DUF6492 family protein n=1 Tax=Nitratireductor sp. StC3 TaxID=2126741 RepID=UPI001FE113DD|nr:DUF6492 family protein [Nitratireductor sp. StC3]
MNVAVHPRNEAPAAAQAVGTSALVTASYAPDFERCRLLCETIDRHVTGHSRHYILVAHADVPLFRALETTNRVVIDERDILPAWLRVVPDPTSLFRRKFWLSMRTKPLRGWHVQQLRRIAIAAHADEDALVYCDSDVVILKDFDCARFWKDGQVRLFRRDDALRGPVDGDQKIWSENAARVLGIEAPAVAPHDYIATFIAWRRDAVVSMCERIERISGRHWVAAIGAERKFSECMIYGRYVDEVIKGRGHFLSGEELCRVYWRGPRLTSATVRAFVDGMDPGQVAIGMQSFIGTDMDLIRDLVRAAEGR